MTSFYDEKDLEEELSRVSCPDEDLEFEYLFEYGLPCSDVAGGGQGLSDAFLAAQVDSCLRLSVGYLWAQSQYVLQLFLFL